MSKYYEVLVQLKIESDKGKIKKVRELYLVDAQSVTEAEARVVKSFTDSGFSQDYCVVSAKGSKVIDVITPDEEPKAKSSWRPLNPAESLKEQDSTEDMN